MKKQPERTAMTRGILIEAFLELCKHKPFDKITISEISAKAGYNRSTFYQYFNDVHHLLSCIEDEMLEYIKDAVVNKIGKVRPENFFVDGFMQIHENKRYILKLLLGGSINTFPSKLKKSLIPLFAEQMHMSMDDEQTIYKLDFYLSGIISIVSRWVTSDAPMPPEEYALLIRQIVEGMSKSKLFPVL